MKTMHCAAVDLGATSGRVIVGTWSHGLLELKEVHRFPNQFLTLGGRDYWDVPYLWNEARKGLIEAKKLFPKLASVGVDAWGVDHVLVDRDGRMVYPTHAYRDTRTEKLSKNLDRSGLPHVYALTGIPNFSYNTSLQLQETLQAVPSVATAAARCLFLADYFNFLLSGKMENELSISSHSQLLDVHGQSWSPKALKFFGVPAKLFPKAPARSPKALGRVRDFDELGDVESIMVPG
ncbi:MAG TPA: FGGY family carbohydrate kinase, partial [Opitutaceae bacterium]